ncbi:MAG: peptidase, partial [Planctomycetaceae bacterium]|nr:peptidase [Planctomycetaceae bacterium]
MDQHSLPHSQPSDSRRHFLKTAGSAVVGSFFAPAILGAEDKAGVKNPVLGEGAFQYEAIHGWGEVPKHIQWGETHGVCVDAAGLIYIKHRSHSKEPMDAIVVFDPDGKFVRSFGKEYHGGGHGIDVRKEGSEEFLYLSDTKHGIVAKTNLKGDVVWTIGRPATPEHYKDPKNRYSPTNIAFAPDGGFYVGDGYGSHFIHKYT